MTNVKIITDSLNAATGDRLTTYLLTYPRYIHAELMTHRVFSRNAASSRAIPTAKFRKNVLEAPVVPVHWGANKPGMAADAELDDSLKDWKWPSTGEMLTQREFAQRTWLSARDLALGAHLALGEVGLHKQIANRVIEPWFHIQVLVSATEFKNWFALRCSSAAHPDIQILADAMLELYVNATPNKLDVGEWHLPFGDQDMPDDLMLDQRIKVCVARAARVSYKNFEGRIDYGDDLLLHDRLASAGHWSPFEHVARAMPNSTWSGNFKGFAQYRKTFVDENREVDLVSLLEQRKKLRGLETLIPVA